MAEPLSARGNFTNRLSFVRRADYVASDVGSGGPSTVAISLHRTLYEHPLSFNMPTEEETNFT
jgi:hypothetical protein